MRLGNSLVVCDLHGLISALRPLFSLKGLDIPKLLCVKKSPFTFFERNFSALKLLNH